MSVIVVGFVSTCLGLFCGKDRKETVPSLIFGRFVSILWLRAFWLKRGERKMVIKIVTEASLSA